MAAHARNSQRRRAEIGGCGFGDGRLLPLVELAFSGRCFFGFNHFNGFGRRLAICDLCKTPVLVGAPSIARQKTSANRAEQCSALRYLATFAEDLRSGNINLNLVRFIAKKTQPTRTRVGCKVARNVSAAGCSIPVHHLPRVLRFCSQAKS